MQSPCGQTTSSSGRPFDEKSLVEHMKVCVNCRLANIEKALLTAKVLGISALSWYDAKKYSPAEKVPVLLIVQSDSGLHMVDSMLLSGGWNAEDDYYYDTDNVIAWAYPVFPVEFENKEV